MTKTIIIFSEMFIDANSQILSFKLKNYFLWFILAFNSGCINIGGFLAAHRFVTHVTGYATHFGEELSNGNFGRAYSLLLVPMFFIAGAMISGWFTEKPEATEIKERNHSYIFLAISIILFVISLLGPFGIFGLFGAENEFLPNYFLIALLAMCSGLQNAMIGTTGGLLVRTSHLTGITTDLAVGLIRISNSKKGSEQRIREIKINLLRAGTVGSFIFGSAVASFTFRKFEYAAFLLPAIIMGALGYFKSRHIRRNKL